MYVNISFLVINYWPFTLTEWFMHLQVMASVCDIGAVFCIICFENGILIVLVTVVDLCYYCTLTTAK